MISDSPSKDQQQQQQRSAAGRKRLQRNTGERNANWMEEERRDLRAYEYLCHVGEAKDWIERCVQEEVGQVTDLDERLRNGVDLAKLARFFAPQCVPRIFDAPKLQFRHSDNTNYFFAACRQAGLPEVFLFELTDVYDKKNIPKVIYCIHALSHFLAKKGIAPKIKNLLGKLEFTDEELQRTEDSLLESGVSLPAFGNVEGALAKELEDEETPEQKREKYLNDHVDDVVKCQAVARGYLARKAYQDRLQHFKSNEDKLIPLQALIKGFLVRKRRQERDAHFRTDDSLAKIIKIQQWIRSKLLNKAFRQLGNLDSISVSSIQSFLHIFEDSEMDIEEELELERLKRLAVKRIRENNQLDQLLNELDIKIALLVRNRITLDELIKTSAKPYNKKNAPVTSSMSLSSISSASPAGAALKPEELFSSASLKSLDKESRQRLELYENLFYLLQTQPRYLSKAVFHLKQTKLRGFMDCVMLPLFNFANGGRDEYLLLKLFQSLLKFELENVTDIGSLSRENPLFIKLVVHYIRGAKERQFLRDLLQPLVKDIVSNKELDFETDPLAVYRHVIKDEEMKTGQKSARPFDVSREEALKDEEVMKVFCANLSELQKHTEAFLSAIIKNLNRMPYGIRFVASQLKEALWEKFPPASEEDEDRILRVVGNFVYYRYMNPAIVAPEGFDVIDQLITPLQRKNVAEISKMLQQIANNRVFESDYAYKAPLNEYLTSASQRMTDYFRQVTEVPNAEEYFQMSGMSDLSQTTKPVIYITPQSIFNTHALLVEILDDIAPEESDPLRDLVYKLGAPIPESVTVNYTGITNTADESSSSAAKDGSTTKEGHEISLTLSNRLIESSNLVEFGANAEIAVDYKNLLLEVKKNVLMLLRVQKGNNLVEMLEKVETEKEEKVYADLVAKENAARLVMAQTADSSTTVAFMEYPAKLTDLKQSLTEQLVKLEELGAHLCELEPSAEKRQKMGVIQPLNRSTNYQGILASIGMDIRNKQRRRTQRQTEVKTLKQTIVNLEDKMQYLEEQKHSYQDYINSCMAQLTTGRKRSGNGSSSGSGKFVMPFSAQWHHMQQLKREGKVPAFGSYKYSAETLYKRGILISLDDRSPSQLDKITLTISSDESGVFVIEVDFMGIKMPQKMELKLEDLLQYQFDNMQIVSLFDGAAKVNVNLLIYLINKKFYK